MKRFPISSTKAPMAKYDIALGSGLAVVQGDGEPHCHRWDLITAVCALCSHPPACVGRSVQVEGRSGAYRHHDGSGGEASLQQGG